MYMRVQYNFAKKSTWRDVVDLSNYTGMEVEHGHNTADLYHQSQAANTGHFNPHSAGNEKDKYIFTQGKFINK